METRERYVHMDVSLDKVFSDGDTLVSTDQHKPAISLHKAHTQMYVDWPSFRRCLSSSCPRQLPMKKPEHTKSAMTHRWKVVERWTTLWNGKEDQQIADEFEILELLTRFMQRRRQGHLACALAAWIPRRL